jgi:hypothetical protein
MARGPYKLAETALLAAATGYSGPDPHNASISVVPALLVMDRLLTPSRIVTFTNVGDVQHKHAHNE